MEFIKRFLKDNTIAFYIAAVIGVLSVVVAVIYASAIGSLGEYMSWLAFVLMLLAPIAFVALVLFGHAKRGAAAMAVLDFAALIVSLCITYNYLVTFAINGGMDAAMADPAALTFIVCEIMLAVCCIGANIAAWLGLKKRQDVSAVIEEK